MKYILLDKIFKAYLNHLLFIKKKIRTYLNHQKIRSSLVQFYYFNLFESNSEYTYTRLEILLLCMWVYIT